MWQKAKVLLAVVLVLTMMLALGSLALANDYSNHWSVHFIDDAISRGWMMGDGKGNYRPEAAITRGEFAVMLWRSLGQPQSEEGCPFDDVSEDAFYYSAVTALYEAGIVNGMSSDVFGPNITLTREMGCAMLARAYKLSPADIYAYQRFVDANAVSEWARLAVSALVEKDYIAGVGDNRIAPLQQLKRGEMAKLLVVAHDGAYTEKVEETPAHIEDDEAPIITTNVAVTMYTVTFDANGGSGAPEAETVAFNTRIAQPVKIPTRAGYEFAGWHTDAVKKSSYNFAAAVKRNITLYAHWVSKGNYVVFFMLNDEFAGNLPEQVIAADTKVEKPMPDPNRGPGHEFLGWYDDHGIKWDFDSVVTRSMVLYAWWYDEEDEEDTFEPPTITTANLPGGTVGLAYSSTLAATGDEPIVWSIISGNLPYGLNLNKENGRVSGTPNTAGTFMFTVKAINDAGGDTKSFNIVIHAADDPIITSTNLPDGIAGMSYSHSLSAEGAGILTWSQESGHLPDGLVLSNRGLISGTPIAAGTFNFTVMATNSTGSDRRSFSITIIQIFTTEAPTIITTRLPDGESGIYYEEILAARGDEPIIWSIPSGNLPSGLILNRSTGAIYGTPAVAGTSIFTVMAENNAGSSTQQLSIIVNAASPTTYRINVSGNPVEGGIVQGSGDYNDDVMVRVTAITNSGYTFEGWYEDGHRVSKDPIYEFLPTADRNLVAVFGQIVVRRVAGYSGLRF